MSAEFVPFTLPASPPPQPEREPEPEEEVSPALRFVTLDEFLSQEEHVPEPLAGEPDDALIPQEGVLLMYGDGGAGKTTLTIDAVAHLASGVDWLTVTVPHPVRVLIIENEGPRSEFRNMLRAKAEAWEGPSFRSNLTTMCDPWGQLDLRLETQRAAIADHIRDHRVQLVCVGPLASIGTQGGGTPDEINEFHRLLVDIRDRAAPQPFAWWMLHHENKSGDVSGAWERYPDTLVHIQGQGNGRTRVYWRKVRWSSRLHGTSVNLQWAAGKGFELEERADRDLHGETLQWLADQGGYRNYGEIVAALEVGRTKLRPVLDQLTEAGHLQCAVGEAAGLDQHGHRRRYNSVCWRIPQPDRPHHMTLVPAEHLDRDNWQGET